MINISSHTGHAVTEWALIDQIEKETEVKASAYDLAIEPNVTIAGKIGDELISDSSKMAFTMKLSRSLIVPDTKLYRNESHSFGKPKEIPMGINVNDFHAMIDSLPYGSATLTVSGLVNGDRFAGQVNVQITR